MADRPIETKILIAGQEDAKRVFKSLKSDAVGKCNPPRESARGWWQVTGELPPLLPSTTTEVLRGSRAALVAQGDVAEACRFVFFDAEMDPVELLAGQLWGDIVPIEKRAEESAEFELWAQKHAPAAPSRADTVILWERLRGASGRELIDGLLDGLRFSSYAPPSEKLVGCTQILELGPACIGDIPINWKKVPFVLGAGDNFTGIWDRHRGGEAIERFPLSKQGTRAARQRQVELVDEPILHAARLVGQRWYAPVDSNYEHVAAPACVAHLSPRGTVSLIKATNPPVTVWVRGNDRVVTLSYQESERIGFDPPSWSATVSLAHQEKALVIADLTAEKWRTGDWTPIPKDVPVGLTETIAWVINQVKR
jgi:hypothetical protein